MFLKFISWKLVTTLSTMIFTTRFCSFTQWSFSGGIFLGLFPGLSCSTACQFKIIQSRVEKIEDRGENMAQNFIKRENFLRNIFDISDKQKSIATCNQGSKQTRKRPSNEDMIRRALEYWSAMNSIQSREDWRRSGKCDQKRDQGEKYFLDSNVQARGRKQASEKCWDNLANTIWSVKERLSSFWQQTSYWARWKDNISNSLTKQGRKCIIRTVNREAFLQRHGVRNVERGEIWLMFLKSLVEFGKISSPIKVSHEHIELLQTPEAYQKNQWPVILSRDPRFRSNDFRGWLWVLDAWVVSANTSARVKHRHVSFPQRM